MDKVLNSISIGICTHNDVSTINVLLTQLLGDINKINTANKGFRVDEIIVVSSDSTDGTNSVLRQFRRMNPDIIKIIVEADRNGKSSAINLIFEEYNGDYLILMPADVSIADYSLGILISSIINSEYAVVSGKAIPKETKSLSNGMSFLPLIWRLHNTTLSQTTDLGTNSHCTGELMIMRRDSLSWIPPHIINDDAYIAQKLKSEGMKVGYAKDAVVFIEVPQTIHDYIKQRKRVIKGHKQLRIDGQITKSNLKDLFFSKFELFVNILSNEITSLHDLKNLVKAISVEMYIESSIAVERIMNRYDENPVWDRISHKPKVLA